MINILIINYLFPVKSTHLCSIDKSQDTSGQFHDENQQQQKEELQNLVKY
jgi:hypothetical protein